MRGFAEERSGQYGNAVQAYDQAIRLDARDKAYWNSKGIALLHLKRPEEALRCFEAALGLDPGYEAAQEGKRTAEERVRLGQIETFAESVVRYERQTERPATREEVFRYCSVPSEALDDVIRYVNEPVPLAPDRLTEENLRRFEAIGAAVLRRFKDLDDLRLADVTSALPNVDLEEAREVWGYLDWVREAHLEPTSSWGNDDLIRQAMDLPREDWNLVDLARELRLGPFEAKKLETSLKIFEGGAYRITTSEAPEPAERPLRRKKPKAKTEPEPADGAASETLEEPKVRGHEPTDTARAPTPKVPKDRRPEEATGVARRCEAHDAAGVEQHACGAWLCKACVEASGPCSKCHEPVSKPKEAPRRRGDKDDSARDFGRL